MFWNDDLCFLFCPLYVELVKQSTNVLGNDISWRGVIWEQISRLMPLFLSFIFQYWKWSPSYDSISIRNKFRNPWLLLLLIIFGSAILLNSAIPIKDWALRQLRWNGGASRGRLIERIICRFVQLIPSFLVKVALWLAVSGLLLQHYGSILSSLDLEWWHCPSHLALSTHRGWCAHRWHSPVIVNEEFVLTVITDNVLAFLLLGKILDGPS